MSSGDDLSAETLYTTLAMRFSGWRGVGVLVGLFALLGSLGGCSGDDDDAAGGGSSGAAGSGGAAGAAPVDPPPPLDAAEACAPAGDACAVGVIDSGIHASYRKDSFFPDEQYDEYTDPTGDGGRFNVAAIASVTGTVTSVSIGGVDPEIIFVENPAETPPFEWFHVWPRNVKAGEPVWVNFHSLDPAWDSRSSAALVVETDAGTAVNGTFEVATTPVPLTYVTTVNAGTTLVMHVKNTDEVAHEVTRVLVNGRDVLDEDVLCIADTTLQPGEAQMWTLPLCTPVEPGEAWTVVVDYANAASAVGAGRVLRERFPVESWNNTDECPFPLGNAENFRKLQASGIDTMYMHGGVCAPDKCDCDTQAVVADIAETPGFFTFLTSDLGKEPTPPFPDTSGIMAFSTGDESDGEIYDDTTGVPNAANKAKSSDELWARYPEVPTFNGGMTNGHMGIFAGMADVQGVDIYIAACAPHITRFGSLPPPRGPYDYLKNTRDNHMPHPTWLYTQGLHTGWNRDGAFGGPDLHLQPDPQEILVQALSVVAAGGKGLMWFQSNLEEAAYAPERWQAITDANRMIRGVRQWLREGDITGMASSDGEVIVDAIRARDAIVVPVIDIQVEVAVDDVACYTGVTTEEDIPHWIFASAAPSISVKIPSDFSMKDLFEVRPGGVEDAGATLQGRTLTLPAVALGNQRPVRLFVIASEASARDAVTQAMQEF